VKPSSNKQPRLLRFARNDSHSGLLHYVRNDDCYFLKWRDYNTYSYSVCILNTITQSGKKLMSDNPLAMLPFPSSHDNDLLYLSILAIEGTDASLFLQGQLTQDVSLCAHGPQMAAALNPKGRAYAQGWLVAIPTGFLWVLPQNIINTTIKTLKRYVLRSKVTLTDASADWVIRLNNVVASISGISCLPKALQTKTGWCGHINPADNNINHTDWLAWHGRCIEVGYAILTPATQEKYTAHELDLIRWEGVSFTKGCYTGQEIVARMHYRATPKTALSLIQLQGFNQRDIAYGDTLTVADSTQNIELVDGQWQADGHLHALAVVPHTVPTTAKLHADKVYGQLSRID
jgi:folate-binding protein YgfZ